MNFISQQIDRLQATLEQKTAMCNALVQKAANEDRSMSASESTDFDQLTRDISMLQADLGRCKTVQSLDEPRGRTPHTLQLKANEKALEPGIAFARAARCKALAFIDHQSPEVIAKSLYPGDERLHNALVVKAPVSAANTLEAPWAGNLILDAGAAFADFVEFLRARSIFGQVAERFRNLPFDTPVLIQGSGATAKWTKEGQAKPLTEWTYSLTRLRPLKVTAIAAATKESLRRASIAADRLLRDELARAVGATIDTTLFSDAAAVTDESPAGLLNGITPLALSGGTSVQDIRCDIATFLTTMSDANLSIAGSFWVMPERVAIALSLVANEVGATAFPGITPTGGTFAGLPVFTSNYLDTDSSGSVVALVRGDEIFLGDEGGIEVRVSDQASLQMDTEPTQNSITPTATTSVSMFQTNSVAFLVERFLNWQRRRVQSIAWARVNWTACGT